MKQLSKLIVLSVLTLSFYQPAYAVSTVSSASIPITADVSSSLTLNVTLHKNSSTGTVVPSMGFGTLQELVQNEGTPTERRTLRSSTAGSTGTGSVVAVISANSHQLPYTIKQTGGALSNGTTNLPAGACTVVPVYATQDNGGAAIAGTLGTAGSWVATDKVLYTSDAGGSLRTIQAHYSITDDSAAGASAAVPINQQGGTYSGSVTFTVTA